MQKIQTFLILIFAAFSSVEGKADTPENLAQDFAAAAQGFSENKTDYKKLYQWSDLLIEDKHAVFEILFKQAEGGDQGSLLFLAYWARRELRPFASKYTPKLLESIRSEKKLERKYLWIKAFANWGSIQMRAQNSF